MSGDMRRQLGMMLARGSVTIVNAATKMQRLGLRLLAGEVKANVEHFEPYGFTSHAKPGSEHLTVFLDGDRSHGITVVVADRRYRLAGLAEGEVALHDDQGQKVVLMRDGIRIEGKKLTMHATDSWSWDVAGFGERWTHTGGSAWEHRTWQTGATVTNVTGAINPPEGP